MTGEPGATEPPAGTGDANASRRLEGVSVLVPRSSDQSGALAGLLRDLGAEPVEAPTISIQPARDPQALAEALDHAAQGRYDWVAFTSPNAVRAVCALVGARELAAVRVAAVGPGTRAALVREGVTPDLVPPKSTAMGLAEALVDAVAPASGGGGADGPGDRTGRILLPRADIASAGLPKALEVAGWQVTEVEAYRTVPVRELPEGVVTDLREGRIDVVAFTSGSTVRSLLGLLDEPPPGGVRIVTIGPTTSAVCAALGLRVDVEAEPHDLDGLVAAVVAATA